MSKIRILIVEDELLIADEMSAQLETFGYDVLQVVDNTTDAKRALEIYQIDIVLIDIQLKGDEDGISLATHISNTQKRPVIFITSHTDPVTKNRALEARPSSYLVKPYNPTALNVAIDMAMYNFQLQQVGEFHQTKTEDPNYYAFNQHVFIKDKHRFERLEFMDILWMKAESSYVSIATKVKNYLLTSDTLGSMLEKIDCEWLLRVHRSYAVNIHMVTAIDGNQLVVNQENIPIGKNYRALIKEHFNIL